MASSYHSFPVSLPLLSISRFLKSRIKSLCSFLTLGYRIHTTLVQSTSVYIAYLLIPGQLYIQGSLNNSWSHCDKWQVTPGQHMENIKKKLKETILQMVGGVMLPLGGCRQKLLWKYLHSVTARIGCTFLNIP